MTIGGQLAAAAGPIGVGGAVNTALVNPSPVFTYSKSKGLFAGVSLEGTVLIERVRSFLFQKKSSSLVPSLMSRSLILQKDANEAFYGQVSFSFFFSLSFLLST